MGLILASVGYQLVGHEKPTSIISIVTACGLRILTHDVVYTIAASVAFIPGFLHPVKGRVSLEQITVDTGVEAKSSNWKLWTKEYSGDFHLICPPSFAPPLFFDGSFGGGEGDRIHLHAHWFQYYFWEHNRWNHHDDGFRSAVPYRTMTRIGRYVPSQSIAGFLIIKGIVAPVSLCLPATP